VTTDLLSVWTDPDTAMHAVGTSLGIFDAHARDAASVLPAESPLRNALLEALLALVDEGELEKRACADGRHAFRWREDDASSAVVTDAVSPRLDAFLATMPRALPSGIDRAVGALAEVRPVVPVRRPIWPRLVATTAPLLLPAVSCLLALLAFVLLGHGVGLAVVAVLVLVGVVGVIRRVPLAGFWTSGLIVAGLLMRLS